jgi:hypothetical protein
MKPFSLLFPYLLIGTQASIAAALGLLVYTFKEIGQLNGDPR